MNRLAFEKSPYLLQHKNNPVDWYPWGEEAFGKARKEDKPVFLSIGYSTCHWCHVMARESFEDEEVAKLLNDSFVSIKVDREERPDIDAVYMRACQAMTGSGGWPMTVFLTPDKKPFFAGTYFPKNGRFGHFGLIELLGRVAELWKNSREGLLKSSEDITAAIMRNGDKSGEPTDTLLLKAYNTLKRSFDPGWGGFGTAPKFPTPHNLLFLIQRGETEMVETTLTAMSRGGIFDQIGGGFSRYSTDAMWRKPHFEKMLYDNALLIIAYSEAGERMESEYFTDIAKRTADYIINELSSPEGGCFCGQDADSEGVEGKYYTFTRDEIISVLGENEGKQFCLDYGIGEKESIPNRIESKASPWGMERLRKLYDYRKKRTSLHRDDKILLSWNAWMIIAFVRSGYVAEAERIQRFIESKMTDADNRLFLRYRDGEAGNDGQLDDYAVYALALLNLYSATYNVEYLENAIFRAEQLMDFFADENGGFFLTAHDAETLISRPKESFDGAIPSGNSVAAMVLESLAQLTGELIWRRAADRQLRYMAGCAEEYPSGHCFAMLAIDKALGPHRQLVACGKEIPAELRELRGKDISVVFKSDENAERLSKCAPFTAAYPVPEEGTGWYLCENGTCRKSCNRYPL